MVAVEEAADVDVAADAGTKSIKIIKKKISISVYSFKVIAYH